MSDKARRIKKRKRKEKVIRIPHAKPRELKWKPASYVELVVFLPSIFIREIIDLIVLKKALKTPPGARLRSLAEFLFSRKTYATILEPVLRDLLDEYFEALKENHPWKARWVRMRGYWSFWSAVFAQMPISALKLVYRIWKAIP